MAKLVEYGLRSGIPQFDGKMLPYMDKGYLSSDVFLIAAGYAEKQALDERYWERLTRLHSWAVRRDYDLYLPTEVASKVPKAWRGKSIYRPEFNMDTLPSCYDFYGMAHWPIRSKTEEKIIEEIVAYISHDDFQNTVGGYLWAREKNVCYAAGRAVLACVYPERLVLFLELGAKFVSARRSNWFKHGLAELERHRNDNGTYRFPPEYLTEKRNSYYLYGGAHMGLGENRRKRDWIVVESTFRMINIKRLMKT